MAIDILNKVKDFFVDYPSFREFLNSNTCGLIDKTNYHNDYFLYDNIHIIIDKNNEKYKLNFDEKYNISSLKKLESGNWIEIEIDKELREILLPYQEDMKEKARQIFVLNKEFSLMLQTFKSLNPEALVECGLNCDQEAAAKKSRYEGGRDGYMVDYTLEKKSLDYKHIGIISANTEIQGRTKESYLSIDFSEEFKKLDTATQIDEIKKLNRILSNVENIAKLKEKQIAELAEKKEQTEKTTAAKQTLKPKH